MRLEALLKKALRQGVILVVIKASAVAVTLAFVFSQFTMQYTVRQRQRIYGTHQLVIAQASQQAEQVLRAHWSVQEMGLQSIGAEILSDTGERIACLGMADDAFFQMEGWSLLDGHWPQAPGEVVMEQLLLDQLHISYEQGAVIELSLRLANGNIDHRQVKLSGILPTYTTDWISGSAMLAGAFLNAWDNGVMQTNLFLQTNHHNSTEALELLPLLEDCGAKLQWNSFAFPEEGLTFSELCWNYGTLMLTGLLCLMCILCVQLALVPGIRRGGKTLRMLGAQKVTLRRYIMFGVLLGWLQAFFIASVLCGLLWSIFHFMGYDMAAFGPVLVLAAILLILSAPAAILMLHAIGMEQRVTKIRRKHTKKSRALSDTPFTLRRFLALHRSRIALQHLMQALVILLLATAFSACTYGILKEVTFDQARHSNAWDYAWSAQAPYAGLKNSDILRLESASEVREVVYTASITEDIRNRVRLLGLGDPRYRAAVCSMVGKEDDGETMPVTIVVLPKDSAMMKRHVPDDIDKGAFAEGRSCVVFMPALVYEGDVAQNLGFLSNSLIPNEAIHCMLKPSDRITLTWNQYEASVECAAVVTHIPDTRMTIYDHLVPGSVIVSESLWCRLFDVDEVYWNSVDVYGSRRLTYEAGDVLMSRINAQNKAVHYLNRRKHNDAWWQKTVFHITLYAVILIFTCGLSAVVLWRMRRSFEDAEAPRLRLLQRIGTSPEQLSQLYRNKLLGWMPIIMLVVDVVILICFHYDIFLLYLPSGAMLALKVTIEYIANVYPLYVWLGAQILMGTVLSLYLIKCGIVTKL